MFGPYLHNIDPLLGEIGGLYLWWYGVSYALGLLQMHLFLKRRRDRLALTLRDVYSLSLFIVVGVLLGGRLIEVTFDEWPLYSEHPWLIPAYWLGGMASHGVMLGALAGVGSFALRYKKPFLTLADELVIPGVFLMGVGRIGNFIDGQIVGSITDGWWGVQFPDAEGFRHPVVLYDGVKNLLLVPFLLWVRKTNPTPGATAARFVFWYAFLRIFIDLCRDYPTHRLDIGTGQTLNILMALLGLGLLIRSRLRRLGRLRTGTPPAPRPGALPDARPLVSQQVALTCLLLFCLTLPSNWTQDIPARYGERHPGLEHSWLYPEIDTTPPREDGDRGQLPAGDTAAGVRWGGGVHSSWEATVRRSKILVAALVLAPSLATAHSPQTESIIEPQSKRAFPILLETPGGGSTHTLAGTAIRTKTFFNVQVYAYGLYVDADAARRTLRRWRGQSARDLERDEAFYSELLEDNFGKTLRLVMTRDVGGDDMADAFNDALAPRVQRYEREHHTSGGMGALSEFRTYFNSEELTKETELVFSWEPGGTLVTSVAGSVRGEINSLAVCWALFDVYLGAEPVMKKGKRTVIERMPEVLGGVGDQHPRMDLLGSYVSSKPLET